MSTLVTLAQAISHLRRETGEDDTEIQRKLDEAESWAIRVMGSNYLNTWTDASVPGEVRSAIMMRLSSLYDADQVTSRQGYNSTAATSPFVDAAYRAIEPWRDHVIA